MKMGKDPIVLKLRYHEALAKRIRNELKLDSKEASKYAFFLMEKYHCFKKRISTSEVPLK